MALKLPDDEFSVTSFEEFLQDEILEQYKKLKCGYCQKLLRDAVQIERCGHVLCKECAETVIAIADVNKRVAQCPYEECDSQLEGKGSYTESLDHQAKVKNLLESPTSCRMCDDWKGLLRDYEQHLKVSHPLRVVQEVPRKNSTHQLSTNDGTVSINTRVVGTVAGFSGDPSCSTDQPVDFPALDDIPSPSLQMVCCETIATPESENRTKQSSEMVSGRIYSPPSLPQQLGNLSLNHQAAIEEQHSRSKVLECQTSPQRNRKARCRKRKSVGSDEESSPKRTLFQPYVVENENPVAKLSSLQRIPLQLRQENIPLDFPLPRKAKTSTTDDAPLTSTAMER